MAFYRARFADAGSFTFLFVGSFTLDAIRPLVETYLASLPATGARERWRDLGLTPPDEVVEQTIEKGIAPKSQVAIVFSGPFEYDEAHVLALRTMGRLLQSRLLNTIRQELGETYSITVAPDAERLPHPQYTVRIGWTCDPARTAALVRRVFEEIALVKATTLSPGQVDGIRESLLREFERNSQDNAYLLGQVTRVYQAGHAAEVAAAVDQPDLIARLTGEAIQRAMRTYLDTDRYVMVTLMPEGRR